MARRRADGDHRQRRLRAARRARRAGRAPARSQRPPGGAAVPSRRGSELPRPDDAPRQGLGRLHRPRDRRRAGRADRADRCGDHRGRSARGGPPARDGCFHGSDPASHGSRDEAGRNRSSPRVRVAVERVADRRGRPHPRACARRAPAPAAGRSGVLPGRRRREPHSEETPLLVADDPEPDARERRVRVRDVVRALRVPASRSHAAPRVACGSRDVERHEREDRRPARPHAVRVRRGGERDRADLRAARDALRAAARAGHEGVEGRRC